VQQPATFRSSPSCSQDTGNREVEPKLCAAAVYTSPFFTEFQRRRRSLYLNDPACRAFTVLTLSAEALFNKEGKAFSFLCAALGWVRENGPWRICGNHY